MFKIFASSNNYYCIHFDGLGYWNPNTKKFQKNTGKCWTKDFSKITDCVVENTKIKLLGYPVDDFERFSADI